jgi:opacity protein-like surface antigen
MKRFIVSAALIATAAATAGAQATTASDSAPGSVVTRGHGSFYVQPYFGYLIAGNLTEGPGQLTLGDKPLYGAQLGYSFSPNFSLVGNVGYSPTRFERVVGPAGQQAASSGNVDLLLYDANLQFRLPFVANPVGSTIAPFGQVGLGAVKFSPDRGGELNDLKTGPTNIAYNVGLGVDVQIRKSIGIRLMAKDYLTSLAYDDFRSTAETITRDTKNKVSNNIGLSAGINFGF